MSKNYSQYETYQRGYIYMYIYNDKNMVFKDLIVI